LLINRLYFIIVF